MTNRIKAGIIALLLGFMLVGGSFVTANAPVYATGGEKVYVCKYVGTPGVDERLQTGQNPIEVSTSAIQNNQWDGTVPGWFSDAHDRSYVLGYVPMTPEPSASDCPAPDQDDNNWTYTVSCDAVSGDKPSGGSVDSNIRIKNLVTGEVRTFNYHGPDNGPAGPFSYSLANDYGVPASWTYFEIQWVQVNGTNYHWEGALTCGNEPTETPSETPTETPSETPTDNPTETVTAPVPTETVTVTPPAATETVTLPPVTVTETVTPPAETVTVTATPTVTATETVTAPPVTETATVTETPTVTATETVTAPPVTETAKVTETPTVTVTHTATATATETVNVTKHETDTVTKYNTDHQTIYSFDELPNTGAGQAVLAVFVIGILAVLLGLWLLIRRK